METATFRPDVPLDFRAPVLSSGPRFVAPGLIAPKHQASAAFALVTLFIDMLRIGLVMPILPRLEQSRIVSLA